MGISPFWWEVEYDDGTTYSEAQGGTYRNINRERLRHFRFRDGTGPIIELTAEDGRTGWNLVWRRRKAKLGETDQTKDIYVMGWVPQGPIMAVDTHEEKVYHAERFIPGDPIFYPPAQHPYEGERWPIKGTSRLINPMAECTD